MKCIICKNEKTNGEFSDEHIFPDSIGGTLVVRSVCKSCNSRLGDNVDIHLVNHWLIQCQRQLLKIPGKSGKIPNPIEKGIVNEGLNLNVTYRFNNKGKPEELYIVPKVEKIKNEDGNEDVTIIVDKKDKEQLPNIVNKMLKRKGLPELTKEEIEKHSQEKLNPSPWMKLNAEIDTKQYKRTILKIAYELACYWLGETYLNDKVGEMIRKCMLDNDLKDEWYFEYPIKGAINIVGQQTMCPIWDNEPNSHIGFLMQVDGKIYCYIRIFRIFEGVIEVSNDVSKYPNFKGSFIAIDPSSGVKRETSLIKEFNRIC